MANTSATGLDSFFRYHADLRPIRSTLAKKPYRKANLVSTNAAIYFFGTVTKGMTFPVNLLLDRMTGVSIKLRTKFVLVGKSLAN